MVVYDPYLASLRRVILEYGNEQALFDHLSRSGRIERDALILLRNINEIVTKEFSGTVRDSKEPYISHLHAVCSIQAVYCGVYDYERLAAALLLKLCDKLHNQVTLEYCGREKQIKKNWEAIYYVLPIARKHGILIKELEATIQENNKRLLRTSTP